MTGQTSQTKPLIGTGANVEPWFEMDPTLTSEEEIGAFIWDANGDRRDMSKGQKAMLAALRPGTAVLLSNTSEVARSFVAKARQVIEWCPAGCGMTTLSAGAKVQRRKSWQMPTLRRKN